MWSARRSFMHFPVHSIERRLYNEDICTYSNLWYLAWNEIIPSSQCNLGACVNDVCSRGGGGFNGNLTKGRDVAWIASDKLTVKIEKIQQASPHNGPLSSLHSPNFPHIPATGAGAELLHPLRKLLTQNANERTLAMQSRRGTRPKLFLTMLQCLLGTQNS